MASSQETLCSHNLPHSGDGSYLRRKLEGKFGPKQGRDKHNLKWKAEKKLYQRFTPQISRVKIGTFIIHNNGSSNLSDARRGTSSDDKRSIFVDVGWDIAYIHKGLYAITLHYKTTSVRAATSLYSESWVKRRTWRSVSAATSLAFSAERRRATRAPKPMSFSAEQRKVVRWFPWPLDEELLWEKFYLPLRFSPRASKYITATCAIEVQRRIPTNVMTVCIWVSYEAGGVELNTQYSSVKGFHAPIMIIRPLFVLHSSMFWIISRSRRTHVVLMCPRCSSAAWQCCCGSMYHGAVHEIVWPHFDLAIASSKKHILL